VTAPPRSNSASLQAACDKGLALHQAGRLDEASRRYQQVLAVDPAHFDALHLLGVLCIQTGQSALGVQFIEQAVRIQPDVAIAHGNLGNGLNNLGRYEEALASCDRAIALNPDHAEAHGSRALALHQLKGAAAALQSYDRVVALKPSAKAYYNQGVMLRELGRFEDALVSFDRAIALAPTYAEACHSRGIVLRALARPREALGGFDRAIELRPSHAEAHYDRAGTLRELGRLDDALNGYDQAIAIKPDYAEAHNNRGNVLTDLARYEQALDSYGWATALRPDYAEAYSNQATALRALRRPEEALACCDRAIALAPGYAEAHNNRTSVLYDFQRLEAALESCGRAIALKPGYAAAHNNRGVILHQLRRLDEALASFDKALAIAPDDAEAHYNQAMVRLTLGDYDKGWPQYERRWGTNQFRRMAREFRAPLWLGHDDIRGRILLIHAEQGLGDTLQFCRYIPEVAARGAKVILEVQAGLERLAARLDGVDQIVTRGAAPPPHDLQAPLMSLPLALGAAPDACPVPYLSADADQIASWASRLEGADGLRVGLCWAGGTRPDQLGAHSIDRRRSLALETFAPLAAVAGVQIYSLQKGPPAAQLAEVGPRWPGPAIIDMTEDLRDFADTAALVANLDLVIACDTSTAHLAGALAKPVWILNRFDACWRWLADRDDSPWYPSARLFRQKRPGDWDAVVEYLGRELAALAGRAPRRSSRA
jgi:tetratricopeptide (TPR) repeat protein